MKEEVKIGGLISMIHRAMHHKINASVREYELTKPQMDMLIFIRTREDEGQEVIQRNVEDRFRISNPTVSNMISRLEAKGLVERNASRKDRRIRVLHVTDKGIEMLDRVFETCQLAEWQMLARLSEEELARGREFLIHILTNLSAKEETACDRHTCQTDQTV